MESMKRIDVLKGIEQILVQKAYETGHISHRADGDWQKQADGSWIPYKGQSSQSAPRAQEPTENTEYGEITEEDLKGSNASTVDLYDDDQIGFSSYANNINIDNGVADNDDLEDVANQILLDNNLEITDENMNKARNAMLSWLDTNGYLDSDGDSNASTKKGYEDLVETPNDTIYSTEDITTTTIDGEDAYEIAGTPIIAVKDPTGKWQVMDGDKIVADGLNIALAHETMVKTMNDKYGFGDEHSGIIKQDFESLPSSVKDKMFTIAHASTKKGYEDFGFSEPRTKKQVHKLIEDIADRLEQEYPNINDMLKNKEHINGDFQREQEETVNDVMEKLGLKNLTDGDYYTRDAVESLYAKIHGHWYDEENSPQSDNADNNHEKYNIDGNVRQKIKDLAYKYNAIYDNGDFDTEQTEDIMREVGLDPTDDSQLDAFSDVMYDIGHGVEKSAVRDMRSAPTIKNMGF